MGRKRARGSKNQGGRGGSKDDRVSGRTIRRTAAVGGGQERGFPQPGRDARAQLRVETRNPKRPETGPWSRRTGPGASRGSRRRRPQRPIDEEVRSEARRDVPARRE